jgi:phosphatidylserine decarboxylase
VKFFIALQYLLPKHWLSRWVGFIAESQVPWLKNLLIKTFANFYKVDWTDAVRQSPEYFQTFNDFFTRELKDGARPLSGPLCAPADGRVSALGAIKDKQLLQAKDQYYSVDRLLGESLPSHYRDGVYATIYLAPRDYHRVHFPSAGQVSTARYIPGDLFSVNQTTAEGVPNLFARNERLVLQVKSATSDYYLVLIGAMIVAGIQPFWMDAPLAPKIWYETDLNGLEIAQGDEAGRFRLGSTAIIVAAQPFKWQVKSGDTVRMGQSLISER